MKTKITKISVMTARLCGLIALVQGAINWAGYSLPLVTHILFGSLLVVALWTLALQARSLVPSLSIAAGALGILIPILGLLQSEPVPLALLLALPWLHVASGIGGIALSEIMAKRLRLSRLAASQTRTTV
jgi:hypothetical protein